MHITGTGVIMLLMFGLIIGGIFAIKHWKGGGSFSFKFRKPSLKNIKKPPVDPNTVLCLNIYPDKIVGEYMLKSSVDATANIWEKGAKKYILQVHKDKKYQAVRLPDAVVYPPERLARMMGCEPLRKLKSLKFKWYEQLAPFAPVVALLIGFVLFVIVKD